MYTFQATVYRKVLSKVIIANVISICTHPQSLITPRRKKHGRNSSLVYVHTHTHSRTHTQVSERERHCRPLIRKSVSVGGSGGSHAHRSVLPGRSRPSCRRRGGRPGGALSHSWPLLHSNTAPDGNQSENVRGTPGASRRPVLSAVCVRWEAEPSRLVSAPAVPPRGAQGAQGAAGRGVVMSVPGVDSSVGQGGSKEAKQKRVEKETKRVSRKMKTENNQRK